MRLAFAYALALLVVSAQESMPSADPLRSDDACMAVDGPGCSTELLQTKKVAESVHLLTSHRNSTADKVSSGCGILSFKPDDILPKSASKEDLENAPVLPGTKDNMDNFAVDLTGVWWISWTGLSPFWFPEQLYEWLGVETGFTFAGMTSNTSGEPWFPAELRAPTGLKRHWIYTDRIGGRFGMYFKADSNPTRTLGITFWNETYAEIGTPASYCPSALMPASLHWMIPSRYRGEMKWPLIKVDDDTWLRPTLCGEASIATYTLRRIISETGKPQPEYWQKFLRQFGWLTAWRVRVYGTDDTCVRKCCAFGDLMWLPEWIGQLKTTCKACLEKCQKEQ